MSKKIGEDHVREMFRRGLAELQSASYFGESNVAQPNHHTLYAGRPAGEPEPAPEPAPKPEIGGHER